MLNYQVIYVFSAVLITMTSVKHMEQITGYLEIRVYKKLETT